MLTGLFFLISAALANAAGSAKGEALIAALAKAELGGVYFDDGAADGTVTEVDDLLARGVKKEDLAAVTAIVELHRAAIPILIEHLSDTRPTHTLFNEHPVPVGVVALDILSNMIGENRSVFFPDCADDGLGACVYPGYYFRPDAPANEMRRVQQHWRILYRQHRITFHYPPIWKSL